MAHFAELDENNVVLRVVVINDEDVLDDKGRENEAVGVAFCRKLFGEQTVWVQTSYNLLRRAHFASPGMIFDPRGDRFIHPQPFPSWRLNAATAEWEPSVPMPKDNDEQYGWDETARVWIKGE